MGIDGSCRVDLSCSVVGGRPSSLNRQILLKKCSVGSSDTAKWRKSWPPSKVFMGLQCTKWVDAVEKVGGMLLARNSRIMITDFYNRSCAFDARFECRAARSVRPRRSSAAGQ
jgi:hypothetical protein